MGKSFTAPMTNVVYLQMALGTDADAPFFGCDVSPDWLAFQ